MGGGTCWRDPVPSEARSSGVGLAATEAGRVIVGVDDELADVPDPAKRSMYADDYLKRVDASAERYLQAARPSVLDACREIVGLYG